MWVSVAWINFTYEVYFMLEVQFIFVKGECQCEWLIYKLNCLDHLIHFIYVNIFVLQWLKPGKQQATYNFPTKAVQIRARLEFHHWSVEIFVAW